MILLAEGDVSDGQITYHTRRVKTGKAEKLGDVSVLKGASNLKLRVRTSVDLH